MNVFINMTSFQALCDCTSLPALVGVLHGVP